VPLFHHDPERQDEIGTGCCENDGRCATCAGRSITFSTSKLEKRNAADCKAVVVISTVDREGIPNVALKTNFMIHRALAHAFKETIKRRNNRL